MSSNYRSYSGGLTGMSTMSLVLKLSVAEGGVENFVLSINYCQINALSTVSILYHLVKTFMTHKKQRPFFNCRTDCFIYSFFPNSLSEWSQLVPGIQNSESIAVFKSKLISFIRPSKRSIFNVNDPEGVNYLTRLRLQFSHLNEHKFRHGSLDLFDPLCNCSLEVENNEHLFLRSLNFENPENSLLIMH